MEISNLEHLKRIEHHIWSAFPEEERIGVLDGLSGIALFYHHLNNLCPDEMYLSKFLQVVEKCSTLVSTKTYNGSLSSGIAGYGWILQYCSHYELLEISSDYYNALDNILFEKLQEHTNSNDFDFMHGALGISMYFLSRYQRNRDVTIEMRLKEFIEILFQKINQTPEKVFFTHEGKGKTSIYFGPAHGLSGIIYCIKRFISILKLREKNVKGPMRKIVDFMISHDNMGTDAHYTTTHRFPSRIDGEGNVFNARLGWCQGDLSIAGSLNISGEILNNRNLISMARNMIKATYDIDYKTSGVMDVSICHGTAGILLQYFLYGLKGLTRINGNTKVSWENELKRQTDNFNTFLTFEDNLYSEEINLLNGSAGVGLTMMTIYHNINPEWVQILNLDIDTFG